MQQGYSQYDGQDPIPVGTVRAYKLCWSMLCCAATLRLHYRSGERPVLACGRQPVNNRTPVWLPSLQNNRLTSPMPALLCRCATRRRWVTMPRSPTSRRARPSWAASCGATTKWCARGRVLLPVSLTGSNQTTCVAAQRAQPQSALRMRLPTNGWTLTSSVLLTFWFIRVILLFHTCIHLSSFGLCLLAIFPTGGRRLPAAALGRRLPAGHPARRVQLFNGHHAILSAADDPAVAQHLPPPLCNSRLLLPMRCRSLPPSEMAVPHPVGAACPPPVLSAGQGRASQFLSATVPEEAGTALNGGVTYRES